MKKKIIGFLIFIGLYFSSGFVSASGLIFSVSPNSIGFDDLVEITGTGFENNPLSRQVCLNDKCISSNNIISWNDNKIVFKFNTIGLNLSGSLIVQYLDKSNNLQELTYYENIFIKPFISEVFIKNNNTYIAQEGDIVTVKGYYFGTKMGTILVGDNKNAEILSWNDRNIQFKVPIITTSTSILKIENSVGNLVTYDKISFQKRYGGNELSSYQTYLDQINFIPYDNKKQYTGKGVVIAVIDDGVYWNHEDLQNSIFSIGGQFIGKNFTNPNDTNFSPSGEHGTAVSGIIAAQNNSLGFMGIAPDAKIMILNVTDEDGGITTKNIIDAIYYAVDNGANVINLSLGSVLDIEGFSESYNEAILYGYKKNVIFVIAAGNGDNIYGNGKNLKMFKTSPVCNDIGINAVIGVGSIDKNGKKSSFSNYGDCIDIWAPGEEVPVLSFESELYTINSGTSFSSPQVTGAIALLKEKNPDIKPWEVVHFLTRSSNKSILGSPTEGILDIQSLLLYSPYTDQPVKPDIPESIQTTISQRTVASTPTNQDPSFVDVSSIYKYFNAIEFVKSKGIVNGYSDGSYQPEKTITRAEFTKILLESKFSSEIGKAPVASFSDISQNEWFAKYVNFAKNKNIINGYADKTFKPNQEILYAEASKIIANTLLSDIRAEKKGEDWWIRFDEKLREKNAIPDAIKDGNHKITRGEMAEVIYRLMK